MKANPNRVDRCQARMLIVGIRGGLLPGGQCMRAAEHEGPCADKPDPGMCVPGPLWLLRIGLLALALLAACVDEHAPVDCGPPPVFPEIAVSLEPNRVVMSRSDYFRIAAWQHDSAAYAACVAMNEGR